MSALAGGGGADVAQEVIQQDNGRQQLAEKGITPLPPLRVTDGEGDDDQGEKTLQTVCFVAKRLAPGENNGLADDAEAVALLSQPAFCCSFAVGFDPSTNCLEACRAVLEAVGKKKGFRASYVFPAAGTGSDFTTPKQCTLLPVEPSSALSTAAAAAATTTTTTLSQPSAQCILDRVFPPPSRCTNAEARPLDSLRVMRLKRHRSPHNSRAELYVWMSACGFSCSKPHPPLQVNTASEIEEGTSTFLSIAKHFAPRQLAKAANTLTVPCIVVSDSALAASTQSPQRTKLYTESEIEEGVRAAWSELVEANQGKVYAKGSKHGGRLVCPPQHKRRKYEAYLPSNRALRKLLARDFPDRARLTPELHRLISDTITRVRAEAVQRQVKGTTQSPANTSVGGHVYSAADKPAYMAGKLQVDPDHVFEGHSLAAWEQVDPSSEIAMAVSTAAFYAFLWATECSTSPARRLRIRAENFKTMAPIFRSILRFLPPVQLQLRMKVLYSQPFSTQSSLDRIPQKPRRSNAQPDDVLHHPCAFAAPGSIWRVNLQSLRSLLNAGSEDKEVIRYASQPSAQIIILPQEKEESSATTASSTSTSKGPTKAVLEKVRAAYAPRCRVIPLAKSGWAQCLRNVPAAEKVRFAKQQRALQRRQKLNKASEKAGDVAVDEVFCIVASINSTCQLQLCHAHSRCGCCHCGLLQGRVLVLDRLKFRGNIGCIIRSAVQANVFSHICLIVDNDGASTTQNIKHAGTAFREYRHTGHFFADLGYYSMFNAPLVPIDCFDSVEDFLEVFRRHDNGIAGTVNGNATVNHSKLVCTELTGTAVDLHSPIALAQLASQSLFLVVGSENKGVHTDILHESHMALEIPALSASVNVSMAFMGALTALRIADTARLSATAAENP